MGRWAQARRARGWQTAGHADSEGSLQELNIHVSERSHTTPAAIALAPAEKLLK